MTLEQIDAALAAWNSRVAAIADNLLELQEQGAYRVLAGASGCEAVALSGATKARLDPALATMPGVLANFGRIHDVVERANALRKELPSLFHGEVRQRELERLLWGPSVVLPAEDLPLAERNLLSGAEASRGLTLDQVLQPMFAAYAALRDAVGLVARAWEELAAGLERAEREAARLEQALADCAPDAVASLAGVRAQMGAVKARSKGDALGALEELNKGVEPALAALGRRVQRVEAVRRGLDAARVRLHEVERTNEAACAACEAASVRIADCAQVLTQPVEAGRLEALRLWLERLMGHCAESTVEAVEVGLNRWRTMAEGCAAQAAKSKAAAEGAVAERRELRGRMDALKAKARVYGRAEQPGMAAMAIEAEQLLQRRPTDLLRVRSIVRAYESELSRGRETVPVS